MKNISNKNKIFELFVSKWLEFSKWTKFYSIAKNVTFRLIDLLFPRNSTGRFKKVPQMGFDYEQISYPKEGSSSNSYAGVFYFMKYKNPAIKKMLWQFKYYLNPLAIRRCTYILYDELIADISNRVCTIPFSSPLPLIHCPSSTYFKGEKGFDHMKELVLSFNSLQNSSAPFFICCTHAVLPNQKFLTTARAQHTGNRKERLTWASERFIISEKFDEYLKENLGSINTIYCIDDVVTTGASLNAVASMIENSYGVKVKSFCLCH